MPERTPYKEEQLRSSYNKYVYDRRDLTVHERTCPKFDTIPDERFVVMTDLPEKNTGFTMAPCCFRRAMIRKGIPDYCPTMDMDVLLDFFDRLGATNKQLETLFWDMGATFRYLNAKTCIIFVKKDTWKIEIAPDGDLKLLHNNYRVNKINYSRTFNRGYDAFHEQNLGWRDANFKSIFRIITEYSWADHIEYLREKDANK